MGLTLCPSTSDLNLASMGETAILCPHAKTTETPIRMCLKELTLPLQKSKLRQTSATMNNLCYMRKIRELLCYSDHMKKGYDMAEAIF